MNEFYFSKLSRQQKRVGSAAYLSFHIHIRTVAPDVNSFNRQILYTVIFGLSNSSLMFLFLLIKRVPHFKGGVKEDVCPWIWKMFKQINSGLVGFITDDSYGFLLQQNIEFMFVLCVSPNLNAILGTPQCFLCFWLWDQDNPMQYIISYGAINE